MANGRRFDRHMETRNTLQQVRVVLTSVALLSLLGLWTHGVFHVAFGSWSAIMAALGF